ncbi:glutaredoxin [Coemansia sp. RSA 2336]|nr:glutaredoxin [Coemansia sp. RSA 2336]
MADKTETQPKNLIELQDDKELLSVLENTKEVCVLYFWASWAAQCTQVSQVIQDLAAKYTKTKFFRIEAENFEHISEGYEISAVPTVIITQKEKVVGRINGVKIAELVDEVNKHCAEANGVSVQASALQPKPEQDLNTRLKDLIESAPVMLFIKGTAAQPRCGFSKQLIGLMNEHNIKYGYFDILKDEQVRQGLKEYSDWPTYPQLYIDGELVGGLDIVKEMIKSGELMEMVSKESIAA